MPHKTVKIPRPANPASAEKPPTHRQVHAALLALANPKKAAFSAGFFKTGKGHYAEGDRFLGITVPELRQLAKQFRHLNLPDCERLLQSPYNDERSLALIILVEHFEKGDAAMKNKVYRLFAKNRQRVNNWNLVDGSAPYIVGAHLLRRSRSWLYQLAQSPSLWNRRIAILATFRFIRAGDFADALKLTAQLLNDKHDLMHKACGWMLREIGKRDPSVLETFLRRHHRHMPRTMLRYAIERFPPAKRKAYLAGLPTERD
jgi:3-methyladenine DNA glycosylase AlkD